MKDPRANNSATGSNDYDEDFDSTDTSDDRAFWRKATARPGGQSRWCMCVFSVAAILLLALIISISLTKAQVDSKFSTVEREMSNLTRSLQSLTSKIQQLEKQGQEDLQKCMLMSVSLNMLKVEIQDMSTNVINLREVAAQLKCSFNRLNNNTQDQCCPLQWTLYSSHCYYFSDYGMSWHQAQDECESMKGQLLVLNSKKEKEFVISHTTPHYYWLGLTDERTGQWEWLDGTPYVMVKSEWMPGQPDNWEAHGLGGGEDCAHFHRDGRYNDDHCSRDYRFVCKSHAITSDQ
ncbi:C-type lectin domain family 10 member A-like [Electrophorus electricus]|uniref:C-type lectin domain family 10 member A-like n=1 Tax=Electrophorus electricus TaxID=8005 RepID=UPI0015CFD5D3|nr:C-type lectin domain family 10 member A-like [Electrophorus electricus]